MNTSQREHTIREIFRISVILKGIDALIEIIGGIGVLFVSPAFLQGIVGFVTREELSDDPRDFIANYLVHWAAQFSVSVQHFAALYLLSHGVIKGLLVVGLLKEKLWSYPIAIVVFTGFGIYQMFRFTFTHSVWLVVLTVLDAIVVALTWHEYRYMRGTSAWTGEKGVGILGLMDVFSHGLWGGIAFGRKRKRDFWAAVLFGMLPDLIPFGPFFMMALFGVVPLHVGGPPSLDGIPQFVFSLYSVTHSLIVFGLTFGAVWIWRKRAYTPLAAWGLHILVDIPTHSTQFFPTPFLWPLSSVHVNGVPWSHPIIFFPDVILLVVLYVWFFKFKGGWSGVHEQDQTA